MITYLKERMNIEYKNTNNDILISLLILFLLYQQKRINDLTNKMKCLEETVSIIENKIDYYKNKLKVVFNFFRMIPTFIENIYLLSIIILHSILTVFQKKITF